MNKTREYEVNEALMMGFQAALLGFDKTAFREQLAQEVEAAGYLDCLLYTSPSPRDRQKSRMPSSA